MTDEIIVVLGDSTVGVAIAMDEPPEVDSEVEVTRENFRYVAGAGRPFHYVGKTYKILTVRKLSKGYQCDVSVVPA